MEKVEEFLDTISYETDDYDLMVKAIADKFNLSKEYVNDYFGDMIRSTINNDEDAYINAYDRALDQEQSLKDSFKNFWDRTKDTLNEKTLEDVFEKLVADKDLKVLRKTPGYRSLTLDQKYNQIWKFAIREYGAFCADEMTLSDACEKLAREDEGSI